MTIYLEDHTQFQSVEELNETVNSHLSLNKYKLNDTDREVFLLLSRYSVKYCGASHLKVSTIANSINKSNRTIQRSLKKLETLKMIEKQPFIRRVKGGYGANLFIILPLSVISEVSPREEATNSSVDRPEASKSEIETFKSLNLNSLVSNTYPYSSCGNPQSFYSVFKQFVVARVGEGSQALISKLYGIFRAISIKQLKFSIHADKKDQFEALALQAINITMQASKKKPVKSILGFFSGVYSNLVSKHIIGFEYDCREAGSTTEDVEWFSLPQFQIAHQS